jgi:hypothetical protein
MKNVFNRQKNSGAPAPAPPGSSTGRLGTASRAAQQQQQNSVIGGPPGSASRRPNTAQKRPTTAIQGAGFTAGPGAFGSNVVASGPSQFEKKEER